MVCALAPCHRGLRPSAASRGSAARSWRRSRRTPACAGRRPCCLSMRHRHAGRRRAQTQCRRAPLERATPTGRSRRPWWPARSGFQVSYGRRRPVTAPGNCSCGASGRSRPAMNISHISRGGICIAMRTVPMLLDFWITWATVCGAGGVGVLDGQAAHHDLPALTEAGVGCDTARLHRQRSDERLHGRAGLEGVGQGAVAKLRARQLVRCDGSKLG